MLTTCCLAVVCLAVPDAEPPRIGSLQLVEPDKLFDQMFREFLFDPIGAQRVRVQTGQDWPSAPPRNIKRDGWLVTGKVGQESRVYFADGDSMAAPPNHEIQLLDFVADCRRRYAAEPTAPSIHDPESLWLDPPDVEVRAGRDLVLAAWLHRLGEEELAAQALEWATRAGQTLALLRRELARRTYTQMVFAYGRFADEEAVRYAERLFRLYGPEAREFAQARQLMDELARRGRDRSLGKQRSTADATGYDGWDETKKIRFLIDALADVETRWRDNLPRNGFQDWEAPIASLVCLGDRAVPLLLDAIENDKRLTRQYPPDYWGYWDRSSAPRLVSVREAALKTLQIILRVRTFRAATAEKIESGDPDQLKQAVAELRDYWRRYEKLPLAERMIQVLNDPATSFPQAREAAWQLGSLNHTRLSLGRFYVGVGPATWPLVGGLWWRNWEGNWIEDQRRTADDAVKPALTVEQLSAAGNAVMLALRRELEVYRRGFVDWRAHTEWIGDDYLAALIELGDRRLAKRLVREADDAPAACLRRKLAYAAHCLGDDSAWKSYAADAAAGKLLLLPNSRSDRSPYRGHLLPAAELVSTVEFLTLVRLPESERALAAFTDCKHPYYAKLARRFCDWSRSVWDDLFQHPYCLAILGNELEHGEPTGATLYREGDRIRRVAALDEFGPRDTTDVFRREGLALDKAAERYHDLAAARLSELVFGMPPYNPLLKEHDRAFEQVRATYRRYQGRFRLLEERERDGLGLGGARYVPDLRALGHAATAADVRAGKALFHLDGAGKLADLALPATAQLRSDAGRRGRFRVLIVQAETADGVTTYGVIAEDAILVLTADELDDIQPLPETKRER